MSELPNTCQVQIELPVVWGEMDAFEHVNNVVYFRYFESARIAYFDRVGVNDFKQQHQIGPILASTQCRFKAPLTYPDTITVGTRVEGLGSDRFLMQYFVLSHKSGRVAAEGEGMIVYYDYARQCKHVIPDPIRQAIMALDKPQALSEKESR